MTFLTTVYLRLFFLCNIDWEWVDLPGIQKELKHEKGLEDKQINGK